ncbi:DNA-binding protein [Methylobacterium sp. DB1607]|nr:DNA-binding protein [Methylobacterium sp. DB1607]
MQAAALLGVHKTTLQGWLAQGCPAVERGDRERGQNWKIDLKDVMEWRIERAVSDAVAAYGGDGAEMSREEADRRRAVAAAHIAEIDLDDRLRNTVSRADAAGMFVDFCIVLKTGISNAVNKMAARAATMTSAAEIQALGEAEWNRALRTAREDANRLWDERFADRGAKPTAAE